MRKQLVLLLLSVAAMAPLVIGARDTRDFGFETKDRDGWRPWGGNGHFQRCSVSAHGGASSMRLSPLDDQRLIVGNKAFLPLRGNTDYTLSGWIKCEETAWAQIGGMFRDAEGERVAQRNVWSQKVEKAKERNLAILRLTGHGTLWLAAPQLEFGKTVSS